MSSYLGFDGSAGQAEEQTALLPADRQPMRPLMDPEEVTKIAIRLKYQIEVGTSTNSIICLSINVPI